MDLRVNHARLICATPLTQRAAQGKAGGIDGEPQWGNFRVPTEGVDALLRVPRCGRPLRFPDSVPQPNDRPLFNVERSLLSLGSASVTP